MGPVSWAQPRLHVLRSIVDKEGGNQLGRLRKTKKLNNCSWIAVSRTLSFRSMIEGAMLTQIVLSNSAQRLSGCFRECAKVLRRGEFQGRRFLRCERSSPRHPYQSVHCLVLLLSGVTPANQTKERSVHELFAGAFRNKSSMWIVLVFLRKNTRIHKNGRNSWTFRFGPFFGLVCRGDSWFSFF